MRARIRRDAPSTIRRHFNEQTNPRLPGAPLPGARRVEVVYQSPALELHGFTAINAFARLTVREDNAPDQGLGIFSAIAFGVEGPIGTVNWAPGAKNSAVYAGLGNYNLVVENLPNVPGTVAGSAVWLLALENQSNVARYLQIDIKGCLVAAERPL